MNLTCCVCDGHAKAVKHWWNRDTGFGLCGKCAKWLKSQKDYNATEFTSYYGHEGVHWFPEEHDTAKPVQP